LIPLTAEENPPGAVLVTSPLIAEILDVVVEFCPTIELPSPLLANVKRSEALVRVFVYGNVRPPPPPEDFAYKA
jgi:hypothetical protein